MEKGFTLIEMLAVIVLLGIIAVIAYPTVSNAVKSAKESALDKTIDSLENIAYSYSSENNLEQSVDEKALSFDVMLNAGFIKTLPTNPETGELLAGCVMYSWRDNQYKFRYDESCTTKAPAQVLMDITFTPLGTINSGWYKSNFYVKINVDGTSFRWCSVSGSPTCEPTTLVPTTTGSVYITTESISDVICVRGYNYEDYSIVTCSPVYKLDKTGPVISGVNNITVSKNATIDLTTGVSSSDLLSGLSGTYSYNPTSVDTSTAGIKIVTYTATDIAGNSSVVTKNITVQTDLPTISFSSTGVFNGNGWAKADFYIQATATADGASINNILWCSGTSNCTPSSSVSASTVSINITTNSASNILCVQATDSNNRTSTVTCSGAYKLDKIIPSISGIADLSVNKNDVVNLTTGVTVSDSLSGINGTFSYNPTTVNTSIAGTTNVQYSVTDFAGNTNTITRKVVVDAPGPTVTYAVQGTPINASGWSKVDFYVKADINDQSGLGIKSAKWCSTTSNTCVPSTDMVGTSITPLISIESNNNRICIQATDNNNKTSSVICSDAYKLDKTLPNFGGVADIAINKNDSVNLTTGVTTGDSLSGINGTYSYNPTTVNTSIAGTTNIQYSVTDFASNIKTITRKVVVDAPAPTVTYTVSGTPFNASGWAKDNFSVLSTINDQSGLGIKSAKWCTATTDTCVPSTDIIGSSVTPTISTESTNNRICIQATDNNNKTSAVICSSAYKLDKTIPTVGTIASAKDSSSVTLTLSGAADTSSGLKTYCFKKSTDSTYTCQSTNSLQFTGLSGSTAYTFNVYVIDNADNSSTVNNTSVTTDSSGPCVIDNTPIVTDLAGNTVLAKDINVGDMVLTLNSLTGVFEQNMVIFINKTHVTEQNITNLNFSDGSTLGIFEGHRLFNVEVNYYQNINTHIMENFINTNYYKATFVDSNVSIVSTKLVSYDEIIYTGDVYDFITANDFNYFANGFITSMVNEFSEPFEFSTTTPLVYDYDKYLADIDIYGLMTYDNFKLTYGEVLPEEYFDALKLERMLIGIGRGYISEHDIEEGVTLFN